MTKPDDIPQDVWEAARQAFIGMTDLKPEALETKRVLRGDFDGMPMLVIAARAIMAERERCLSIMNTKVPGILGPNDWPNYVVGPIASR